jgi:hypothetical protein
MCQRVACIQDVAVSNEIGDQLSSYSMHAAEGTRQALIRASACTLYVMPVFALSSYIYQTAIPTIHLYSAIYRPTYKQHYYTCQVIVGFERGPLKGAFFATSSFALSFAFSRSPPPPC